MGRLVEAALTTIAGTAGTSPSEQIDLPAEATLDPSIYPATSRKQNHYGRFRPFGAGSHMHSPSAVFLTGATGYLGAHILAELLTSTDVQVFALVRATDTASGRDRLEQTLQSYNLLQSLLTKLLDGYLEGDDEKPWFDNRVCVVLGDLSKPLLGLTQEDFKELAISIDSIIHCGADVNLVKPYEELKAANVLGKKPQTHFVCTPTWTCQTGLNPQQKWKPNDVCLAVRVAGTQEVLRLSVTNGNLHTKVKPVHYISTNSVFPIATQGGKQVFQDEDAPLEGVEVWVRNQRTGELLTILQKHD